MGRASVSRSISSLLVILLALAGCLAPASVPCGENGWCPAGSVCTDGLCRGVVDCGDGRLQPGEICDEGPANSDDPEATCRSNCKPRRCGDGIVDKTIGPGGEPAEACDDGVNNSDVDPDRCRETCVQPSCG